MIISFLSNFAIFPQSCKRWFAKSAKSYTNINSYWSSKSTSYRHFESATVYSTHSAKSRIIQWHKSTQHYNKLQTANAFVIPCTQHCCGGLAEIHAGVSLQSSVPVTTSAHTHTLQTGDLWGSQSLCQKTFIPSYQKTHGKFSLFFFFFKLKIEGHHDGRYCLYNLCWLRVWIQNEKISSKWCSTFLINMNTHTASTLSISLQLHIFFDNDPSLPQGLQVFFITSLLRMKGD